MKEQKNILTRYKEKYPKETLKQTQQKTGIHYTRVFRLYNGSEMKLKEYLCFQSQLLDQNEQSIQKKLNKCIRNLSDRNRNVLFDFIDKTLFLSELKA